MQFKKLNKKEKFEIWKEKLRKNTKLKKKKELNKEDGKMINYIIK